MKRTNTASHLAIHQTDNMPAAASPAGTKGFGPVDMPTDMPAGRPVGPAASPRQAAEGPRGAPEHGRQASGADGHHGGPAHGEPGQAMHGEPSIPPSGVEYTEAQLAELLYMIEEEKLAGDVYEVLADQTGLTVFERIAHSEDRHHDTLVAYAEAAGLDLSALELLPAGQYSDPTLQSLYDSLLLQAAASTTDALEVGVLIETTDIADLQQAIVGLVGTPLGDAYANLLDSSTAHLTAFDGLLGG